MYLITGRPWKRTIISNSIESKRVSDLAPIRPLEGCWIDRLGSPKRGRNHKRTGDYILRMADLYLLIAPGGDGDHLLASSTGRQTPPRAANGVPPTSPNQNRSTHGTCVPDLRLRLTPKVNREAATRRHGSSIGSSHPPGTSWNSPST